MTDENERTVFLRRWCVSEKNEDEPLPITSEDRETIATVIERLAQLLRSAASDSSDLLFPLVSPRPGYYVKLNGLAFVVSAETRQVHTRTRLFRKQIQLRRVLKQLQKTHEPALCEFIVMREGLSKTSAAEEAQPLLVKTPRDFLLLCENPQELIEVGPKALNQTADCYERVAKLFLTQPKTPIVLTTSQIQGKSGY